MMEECERMARSADRRACACVCLRFQLFLSYMMKDKKHGTTRLDEDLESFMTQKKEEAEKQKEAPKEEEKPAEAEPEAAPATTTEE